MNGIEELRQRVLVAEEQCGLIDERSAQYSRRLTELMDAIEGRIQDQQAEIDASKSAAEAFRADAAAQAMEFERQTDKLDELGEENEQLRAMLHSVLQAIEQGNSGSDSWTETLQELDRRATVLIGQTPIASFMDAEDTSTKIENDGQATETTLAEAEEVFGPEMMAAIGSDMADDAELDLELEPKADAGYADDTVMELDTETVSQDTDAAAENTVAVEVTETSGESDPGGLDEIMARVSKLVEETDGLMADPETSSDDVQDADEAVTAEEVAENLDQKVSAAGS